MIRHIAVAVLLAGMMVPPVQGRTTECIDKVDVSDISGPGSETIAEIICDVTVWTQLESARAWDSYFDQFGETLPVEALDTEEGLGQSAKLVEVEFRVDSILTFTDAGLKEKIEEYMAGIYIDLFSKSPVPLLSVRVSASSMMSDGQRAVVYGTSIRNEGVYGPGNFPTRWETWRLHPDFR